MSALGVFLLMPDVPHTVSGRFKSDRRQGRGVRTASHKEKPAQRERENVCAGIFVLTGSICVDIFERSV